MRRVLVVDDEENVRVLLKALLRRQGYDVETASDGCEALRVVDAFLPDFVLTDVMMPKMGGLEFLGALRERRIESTVIVMSAYGNVDLAIEAMKAGAYDYVQKPFNNEEIVLALRKAEERETLRLENRSLRAEIQKENRFEALLGKSNSMQLVFKTIAKVADFKTTVLILGESGVGKELVARAIHARSSRNKSKFVAINCGAIPGALLESELFGHRKGAFTDADVDRRGLFEEANGGTLFLDEVGELPLPLQVKLLRVLQDDVIRKLGENRDIQVDVRIVGATNRDLETETAAGRFRDDLFYRLNVLPLRVPPLRERRDDIPILVDHFLTKNNARLGTKIRGFDQEARQLLYDYSWPGNVRELENSIERAMVLCESDVVVPKDLPEPIRERGTSIKTILDSNEMSIKKATRCVEETLIRRALEATRGNKTHAAKILEISPRALLYKIKEFGLGDNR